MLNPLNLCIFTNNDSNLDQKIHSIRFICLKFIWLTVKKTKRERIVLEQKFLKHCFFLFFFYFLIYFFSAVQHGIQVTLTCIHFFPSFVLLQYKYVDIVLNATQQNLIVNPFQVVSDNPKFPIPPTPSLSPKGATSLFSRSMILFSVERFGCAVY